VDRLQLQGHTSGSVETFCRSRAVPADRDLRVPSLYPCGRGTQVRNSVLACNIGRERVFDSSENVTPESIQDEPTQLRADLGLMFQGFKRCTNNTHLHVRFLA
jgi:hypothetical protein